MRRTQELIAQWVLSRTTLVRRWPGRERMSTYCPLHLGLACAVSGIVAGAQQTFAGEMNEMSLSVWAGWRAAVDCLPDRKVRVNIRLPRQTHPCLPHHQFLHIHSGSWAACVHLSTLPLQGWRAPWPAGGKCSMVSTRNAKIVSLQESHYNQSTGRQWHGGRSSRPDSVT